MAFEINELKVILILVMFAIPMIASTNINCSGRAFHCVNSTHFMICVDLGGGLSTTIDDFVIPCPATTVCHENNIFECDFPEVNPPPLQVIGVYKQSDTSELTSVTDSVTVLTPTSEIFRVFKENNTATTLAIPEEVTPVVKLEVLENIKNPVGVNSDTTTETSFKATPSPSFFVKQASNKTITTSATDNNKHLKLAVKTSIHESVNISSTDKSKSIDTVTSVIGLINLISTDPPNILSTMSSSNVLTSLDTNIVYANIDTTTEQYKVKQVLIQEENVGNITDKIIIQKEIINYERSMNTDEFNKTPVVETYVDNINKTNSNNQTSVEPNSFDKSTISSSNPETATEYLASVIIVNVSEPITIVPNPQIMANNPFVPLGLVELNSSLNHTIRNPNLTSEYSNTLNDNHAATVNQYASKQETILSREPTITEPVTTTPILNANNQSFYKYGTNNNSFTELNTTADIVTVEKVSETNLKSFIPESITTALLQTTTERPVPITTGDLFNNHSTVDKQTTVTKPLEISITTNTPIELTDNLYQINPEFNQSMFTNTVHTMNATGTIKTVYKASSTETNNNVVTERTLFLPTILKNPAIEISRTETLQNGFTAYTTQVNNELPVTNALFSVTEPNKELVETNIPSIVHKTPHSENVKLETVTNTTVKDFVSQSDGAVNKQTSFTPEIIVPLITDGYTSIDLGTTQKVIKEQDVKISGFLNQMGNEETVLPQETSNTKQGSQTVQQLVGMLWNNYENSSTASFPTNTTESVSDSIKIVKQDNIMATSVVITQNLLPKEIQRPTSPSYQMTEVFSTTPETVYTIPSKASINALKQAKTNSLISTNIYRATMTDKKIETSTSFPEHVTTTMVANIATTYVENATHIPMRPLPQQELLNQKTNIGRQINASTTATETVGSTVKTSGYVLNTTKNIDFKTSKLNQTFTDNTKKITSKVDSNIDLYKTETVNPLKGARSVNGTSVSSTEKPNLDESIKIVSVLDIVNSSVTGMLNEKLQPTSSRPSLSNDYVTSKSQDSTIYVTATSATNKVSNYNLVQVRESTTQKNPLEIVSLGESTVITLGSSTPSSYTSTLPITEFNTEKVQNVSTEAPVIIKTAVDYVAVKPNNNIFSTEETHTQLNKLPKVEAESSVSLNNYLPGTAVTPDGLKTVPVNDEVTTNKITASPFIVSTTEITAKNVTDKNIKTTTESSLLALRVPQASKYNTEFSLPILDIPASQMTTEPTLPTSVFVHTAPLGTTNQNVLPGIKTTDFPQYVMSKVNNNIPKTMESLPIARVTASQMSTEPTYTSIVFPQETLLVAAADKSNEGVPPGIRTTGSPQYVMSTENNNIPKSMALLTIAGVTAPQIFTEPTYTNNVFAQDTLLVAAAGKMYQGVLPEINNAELPQYLKPVVNNSNPQPIRAVAVAEVTSAQMTTEPIYKHKKFAGINPLPLPTTGNTYQNVLPRTKTTDFLQYITTTEAYNNSQSISNITTETITDSQTVPDSMVETIKLIEDKVSGTYFGDTILSDVMSNNPTVNNANHSVFDHQSIVIGTTPKENVQNTKMDKAEIVNQTESSWMRSDVNIDSVKIKEASIEDENPDQSVLKSSTDVYNKTLLSDSSKMSKIELKDGITVDKIEHRLSTATTNYKETEHNNAKQSKPVTIKENKNANIDSSANINIEIDVPKYQVQVVYKNISDIYNINNTKTNITASHHNLSLQNSTINDELEQHLISTNHTITTEVQSHLNEGDKQSNKTSDALTFNLTSMHNPNSTSIKLNASSKYNRAVPVSDSVFNCSNHIRGKYADKKDCRKFYTCMGNLQSILGTCPNNTVFSEINKQCTRNLSHCVRNNQFRCLFEGRFSDFFKDKIYYICVKNRMNGFIRYKLQCQDDYHLNKESVKCEKNEDISIQSASSVSEMNNDESKPKPKSEKLVSTDDFECEHEGKFPYAKDCSKYYVCTKTKNVYRRKIKKCANDEVFDKKKKKCVESDSGEC